MFSQFLLRLVSLPCSSALHLSVQVFVMAAETFAFASSHSSKVRFIDASSGQWTPEVKPFPRGIGKLVESAGELLFFVRVNTDTSEDPPMACAQVTTWNPFSNEIDTLPRPHNYNTRPTRCFPHLVSAQLFDRQYAPTYMPIVENDRLVRYINRRALPPPEGYMFTMISLDGEDNNVRDTYYSSQRSWYPANNSDDDRFWHVRNCDGYVVQDAADTGLHPPGILFRNTSTGSLVKFDAPEKFNQPIIPNPHALDPFDKLDDTHTCVFVMQVPGSYQSMQMDGLTRHYLQVERAFINRDAPVIVRIFKSPEIKLRNVHMSGHIHNKTYVYGAKTGALVVQKEPFQLWMWPLLRTNADVYFPMIHLYKFDTSEWIKVDCPQTMGFESDEFIKGQLCQSTPPVPENVVQSFSSSEESVSSSEAISYSTSFSPSSSSSSSASERSFSSSEATSSSTDITSALQNAHI